VFVLGVMFLVALSLRSAAKSMRTAASVSGFHRKNYSSSREEATTSATVRTSRTGRIASSEHGDAASNPISLSRRPM
jgi:hypothetical protein